MMHRHKTLWTWVSGTGGVLHFNCLENARAHALQYGGLGIYPPLYAIE